MKQKINILNNFNFTLILLVLVILIVNFTFVEGAQMHLLLNDSNIAKKLLEAKGFSEIFNVIFQVILALAAIWAVIELTYYGAKYALLDSFTGKKNALDNIWPITYGIIALLATYILFKQINPQILNLSLTHSNIRISSTDSSPGVDVNNNYWHHGPSDEELRRRREEKLNKLDETGNNLGINLRDYEAKFHYDSDPNKPRYDHNGSKWKEFRKNFHDKCESQYNSGICEAGFTNMQNCLNQADEQTCQDAKDYFQYLD